ncbi:MAG: T9SS type A sorting domain-containing protein [candidate division Zixibacteria bacterium]|nr:T9SS type A sorting domain-containing protein [candidate division Zixibacteria bacterium]
MTKRILINSSVLCMIFSNLSAAMPREGSFEFDGVIHNNTTSYRIVDIWVNTAYCGNYPNYIAVYYSFGFTITVAKTGDNDKWTLSGWFDEQTEIAPDNCSLNGIYPNPFNASTTISYSISHETDVRLEIFNLMGQRVDVPVDERQKPGEYAITWDASGLSSGVYFAILNTGEKSISRRMTLVK